MKNENEVEEDKKNKKQEQTVEKGNKAKRMLYKETSKKCGLGKRAGVASDFAKKQAMRKMVNQKHAPKPFNTGKVLKTVGGISTLGGGYVLTR